jgi:hypothetical protein
MRVTRGTILRAAVCVALLLTAPIARADSLDDLVRRADRILRGTSSAAVLHMDVKTAHYDRSYRMVIWDQSGSGQNKALVRILGPTSWRGYSTLKVGSLLKFYDPKTNHIQIVGSSMLGDSWAGSHFTNDDLVKETQLAVHYNASLIEEHAANNELGQPAEFYRIKLLPKPTAPVVWGRIEFELWQRGDVVIPVKTDYFTRDGDSAAARTMRFWNVMEMGGRPVPTQMEVTVASKPGEYTRLTYDKIRFDVEIPESQFTEQAMR